MPNWKRRGKAAVAGRKDEDKVYCALRSPDDLLVVAATETTPAIAAPGCVTDHSPMRPRTRRMG